MTDRPDFDPLVEADLDATDAALRAQLDRDGYLFLRGLFPAAEVLALRSAVLGALDEAGWLVGDPADALPSAGARREEAQAEPAFFEGYRRIQSLQRFHELAHHPSVVGLASRLVGDEVLVHPRKIARVGLPHDDHIVAPHQDHPLIQGTPDVLTVWVPVGDAPDELGGLRVLTGSHRGGLRPVRANVRVGGLELVEDLDGEAGWRTADFRAGDALVFHSLTIHAAKPNRTDRLRMSVDYRYQALREPVVEGTLVPHYYPAVPGHDELTAGWTSADSVRVPDDVVVGGAFDPFEGPPTPVTSRLVSLAGR